MAVAVSSQDQVSILQKYFDDVSRRNGTIVATKPELRAVLASIEDQVGRILARVRFQIETTDGLITEGRKITDEELRRLIFAHIDNWRER